jgi:ABC-type branched-subunit amino acid transport system substrate-binding protein
MFSPVLLPSSGAAAKKTRRRPRQKPDAEYSWAGTIKASFDINRMSDMSDFDPGTWVSPKGDTIKIAYVNAFSGPAAINGYIHYTGIMFAVADINKRGGLSWTVKEDGGADPGRPHVQTGHV